MIFSNDLDMGNVVNIIIPKFILSLKINTGSGKLVACVLKISFSINFVSAFGRKH